MKNEPKHAGFDVGFMRRHEREDLGNEAALVSGVVEWAAGGSHGKRPPFGGRVCRNPEKRKKGPFSMYGNPYTQNDPFVVWLVFSCRAGRGNGTSGTLLYILFLSAVSGENTTE